MEFALSPELEALQREAEAVAADAVERFGRFPDCWINGYSRELSMELGARGWIGMTWPREYGGGGRPAIERFVVTETLIRAGAPIAAHWFADRQMGPTILAYGTEEQKRRFLPGIVSGRAGWCIGMSEPGAGSDLAGVATSAVRDGDAFVVNGQKIWTSFGNRADFCYLICRTSSDGPRHAGISELIVEMDSPGIEVRPIRDMTGNAHFCEVWFDDVRVPVANLVGVEGASFKQAMRQLEHERGGVDRLLANHILYRRARERADRHDPLVRQEIARLESAYMIGRLLVLRETLQQAPRGFSAATKSFCTEHQQRVARFAATILGPHIAADGDDAAAFCYHPAYTIMGGTAQVLRNVLAERLLGLPKG